MSLTKILNKKDADAEDTLTAVAEIVASARKAYGNEDAEIAAPSVQTVHGSMPFDVLEADSKVEILRQEVGRIKAAAVEFGQQTPGANVDKQIEQMLATNALFVNVSAGTRFEYL